MKIRLDFVTNSSSSSYLISVSKDESATLADVFERFNPIFHTNCNWDNNDKYRQLALRVLRERLEEVATYTVSEFRRDLFKAGFPAKDGDHSLSETLQWVLDASLQIANNPDKIHVITNPDEDGGITLGVNE